MKTKLTFAEIYLAVNPAMRATEFSPYFKRETTKWANRQAAWKPALVEELLDKMDLIASDWSLEERTKIAHYFNSFGRSPECKPAKPAKYAGRDSAGSAGRPFQKLTP